MATSDAHDNSMVETKELEDNEAHFSPDADIEKTAESHGTSTHSDDPTLAGILEEEDIPDPNIVDWDGPDDPENPTNWSSLKKWTLVASLSAATFVTPLASSFFAPGVPQVMKTFSSSSNIIAALVVSIYLLGFAIGPLLVAPLSELYGRRIVYNISTVLFVIFTICCAVSKSMGMLIAFRVLAGCAGSTPLTIGGGTIADLFPPEKRAGAIGIWCLGPLVGPCAGPIMGGFLTHAKGWRWVFWIITIMAGGFGIIFFVLGPETYHATILQRKTVRLRKETGNPNLRSKLDKGIPPKEVFQRSIIRPMKMLTFSPIVFLTSLYIAINYGTLYLFFTTITFVFEQRYGFKTSLVGLAYLGMGVGMAVGMVAMWLISDKSVLKHQKKGDLIPEHRLNLLLSLPGAVLMPMGMIIYGWTANYHVHWIVPIAASSFIGLGNLTSMLTVQTYLIDAFTIHAASASAANTVLRSIFGAFLPLAGLSMYDALGLGWGNTLLGFVAFAMIPVPIVFRFYGERIRTKYQVQF